MEQLRAYRQMIKQSKIDAAPTEDWVEPTPIQFHERKQYIFTQRYKRKYHFGEVFNRILCWEKNKPDAHEIEQIKQKLGNDFTMDSIYRNTTYNQRKHLTYIWHVLNNITLPISTRKLAEQKQLIMNYLNMFYSTVGTNKAIKYRLVIDVICEHFGLEQVRALLYFKNNEKYREKVRSVLKFE